MGGISTKLIERNTTIPTSKTQVFSTAADNQPSVEIHVLQGEREMASGNKSLGRFILDGIPPAPRGVPQVEVTFDIDANGILSVKAKDKATGKEQSIRIEASSGLSKEDIEKMKQDAEAHAEEDKKKKETVEVRNTADTLVYATEKSLRDLGDKAPADIKKVVEEKVEAVKKVKDGDDVQAIKTATEELSHEAQKIGEILYKQQQEAPSNSSGQEAGASPSSASGQAAGTQTGQQAQGGETPQQNSDSTQSSNPNVRDADFEDPSTGSPQQGSGQAGQEDKKDEKPSEDVDENPNPQA
jgi:molecular chaperone DnaK